MQLVFELYLLSVFQLEAAVVSVSIFVATVVAPVAGASLIHLSWRSKVVAKVASVVNYVGSTLVLAYKQSQVLAATVTAAGATVEGRIQKPYSTYML